MIPREERLEILKRKPATLWEGEPRLGSAHGEDEIGAAVAAMRDSEDVGRGFTGPQIPAFEAAFAAYIGTKHAVAMNSAGPGLDTAMRYLNLQPGDEVIVPAINFVASPLAVAGAGGQVVWCEVDPKTLQLDPNDVERRITPRTRAICPVHMNGLAAPVEDILELAQRHPHGKHGPLTVIWDAARACGGEYKGQKLGRQPLLTLFSFHTMKNMVTLGEGGMMTTDSDDVARFFRSSRFYGFDDMELWGSSYVMNKVQAAVGLVQLGKLDGFIAARRRLAQARNAMLAGVPELTLPFEPEECMHTYYLYTCLVCPEWAGEKRDRMLKMMDELHGVRLPVLNPPAYQVHKFLRRHTEGQSLPLSEELGARLFCIPTHPAMSDEDNAYISAALVDCIEVLR
jgi:perosamine synthetase